ncbi:MAG: ribosome maturation factor RimP [Cyclobacteriaceae bacterium]|jgi:ribosome maturation factor RimP
MMEINEKIQQLAQASLTSGSHFLVGVHVAERQNPPKIIVWADGDQGLTIDDCAEISRRLAEKLDQEGIYTSGFTLEVSSPGIDQPLRLARQYQKNVGRSVKVTRTDKSIARGVLLAVSELGIALTFTEGTGKKAVEKKIEIPFSEIDKTTVTVSFK